MDDGQHLPKWAFDAAHEVLGMMRDLKFRSDSLIRVAEVIAKHASEKEDKK